MSSKLNFSYIKRITPRQISDRLWKLEFNGKMMKIRDTDQLIVAPSKLVVDLLLSEWDRSLSFIKEKPLPMTSLIYRASQIHAQNEQKLRSETVASILKYYHTDTICYFNPETDIKIAQEFMWNPIINRLEAFLNCQISSTESLSPVNHSEESIDRLKHELNSYDAFILSGLETVSRSLKSCLLAISLKLNQITLTQAIQASYLEFDLQEKKWGQIPEFHLIDRQNIIRQVSLASLLL